MQPVMNLRGLPVQCPAPRQWRPKFLEVTGQDSTREPNPQQVASVLKEFHAGHRVETRWCTSDLSLSLGLLGDGGAHSSQP